MPSIETSTVTPIKLSLLVDAPENVRKLHNAEAFAVLKASIRAKGVLQNLIVYATDKGKFAVTAGARRRAVLLDLRKERAITSDFEVPCLVRGRDEALALSLAENVARENMHPADELVAFKNMTDQGQPIEDVAAQFGVTPAVVRQRLKLACVSPVIMNAFRADDLSLSQVMGFTLTDDHTKQEAVFAENKNRLGWITRHEIVRMLTEQKIRTSNRIYVFAGEEYLAAGGTLTADLFAEDGESYADDGGLLHRVANTKLETFADIERAKGWKWVEVDLEHTVAPKAYGRADEQLLDTTDEEDAQRKALCDQIEALEAVAENRDLTDDEQTSIETLSDELEAFDARLITYAPEVMALAGGWLTVDHDGKPDFRAGYVKPEGRAALDAMSTKPREANVALDTNDSVDEVEPEAVSGPKLSDTLLTMMHKARTEALRDAVAKDRSTALGLLTYQMATSAFLISTDNILTIAARGQYHCDNAGLQNWKKRLPDNQADMFTTIMTMNHDDLLALLAVMIGAQVDASYQKANPTAGLYAKPGPTAERLASHLQLDMSTVWQPTEDSYFRHVNKTQALDAVREAKGEDAVKKIANLKKGEICVEAAKLMTGSGWLPAALRTKS